MSWGENWTRVRGLWPEWSPTDGEADIWRQALGRRDQERVREAVDLAKTESRSWTPNLSAVLAQLRGLGPSDGGPVRAPAEWASFASIAARKRLEFLEVYAGAPVEMQQRVRKFWGLGSDPEQWGTGEACAAAGGVDAERRKAEQGESQGCESSRPGSSSRS